MQTLRCSIQQAPVAEIRGSPLITLLPLTSGSQKCGFQTSSISITWEFVGNASSWASSRPTESETLDRAQQSVLLRSLLGFLMCDQVWEMQVCKTQSVSQDRQERVFLPKEIGVLSTQRHLSSGLPSLLCIKDGPVLSILGKLRPIQIVPVFCDSAPNDTVPVSTRQLLSPLATAPTSWRQFQYQ